MIDVAETMRQDRQRRRQREQREAIELWLAMNPAESQASQPNLRGIGIVGKPPVSKASQDSWSTPRNRRTRTVGVAPGTSAANGPTYRVTYADGSTAVLPVPSRKRNTGRPSHSNPPQDGPRYNRFNQRIA